jgi:hypothetical protein
MRARLSETSALDDDMSDKAGWMYADLFLALMVIFLATISFVPEISASDESANQVRIQSSRVKQTTDFNFDRGLTLLLKSPDGQAVSSQIKQFIAGEKLPSNAQIVFMKVIGGYEANSGGDSEATTRAIKFAMKLKENNLELLGNATISIDVSTSVPSDQVALVLTFASFTKK